MQRYATIEKRLGETPLEALERFRASADLPHHLPLAYAGRLDPMASGKLLILIGNECKRQATYHNLDKEYFFSVLFGLSSDTGDILGIIGSCAHPAVSEADLKKTARSLQGSIELPYPHFSSKTVHGKPLHVWTLEGRLHEIEIPRKRSSMYRLELTGLLSIGTEELCRSVLERIETVTTVTEESKKLGRNFRRDEVRAAWGDIRRKHEGGSFQIASFRCIASSGTYMRSLSEHIAENIGTCGLAFSIKRTQIGRYVPIWRGSGFWVKRF